MNTHLLKMIGQTKYIITFICLGNICRSPLAAGIFEALLKKLYPELYSYITVNSAATRSHTRGQLADDRAIRMAKQIEQQHNLTGLHNSLLRHRAKKVTSNILIESDFLIVMDKENYDDIIHELSCITENQDAVGKVFYFGDFSKLVIKNLVKNQKSKDLKNEMMLNVTKQIPNIIIRDPWYGTMSDFERVAQISIESSKGLLQLLKSMILKN